MELDWTKTLLHLGSYAVGAVMVAAGSLVELGLALPGVSLDNPKTVVGTGIGIIAAAWKADRAAAAVIGFIALAAMLASPASAANLNPPPVFKAPAAYQSTPCTVSSCTGFFIGGNIGQAGGNFDIVGTGLNGLAQNGLSLGGQLGYEFWNGSVYAAVLADLDADAVLNGQSAVGVPTNFKDKLTYGVTARLGYSLASVFGSATTGTATPTLPQQLLASLMTPYIDAGEVWRHGQAALRSGAGIEALVATNWTVNVDYYHYSYDQGGSAGNIAGIPISQTNDNEIRLSINRHFGL